MLKTEYIVETDDNPVETHYIFWWLGRESSQRDFESIKKILWKNRAIIVRGDKNSVDFRIFYGNNVSLHIIIRRKYWGFVINSHLDIGIHSHSIFNKRSLELLSKLYLKLKEVRYGKCFLLPRQMKDFKRFMMESKRRWNLI